MVKMCSCRFTVWFWIFVRFLSHTSAIISTCGSYEAHIYVVCRNLQSRAFENLKQTKDVEHLQRRLKFWCSSLGYPPIADSLGVGNDSNFPSFLALVHKVQERAFRHATRQWIWQQTQVLQISWLPWLPLTSFPGNLLHEIELFLFCLQPQSQGRHVCNIGAAE